MASAFIRNLLGDDEEAKPTEVKGELEPCGQELYTDPEPALWVAERTQVWIADNSRRILGAQSRCSVVIGTRMRNADGLPLPKEEQIERALGFLWLLCPRPGVEHTPACESEQRARIRSRVRWSAVICECPYVAHPSLTIEDTKHRGLAHESDMVPQSLRSFDAVPMAMVLKRWGRDIYQCKVCGEVATRIDDDVQGRHRYEYLRAVRGPRPMQRDHVWELKHGEPRAEEWNAQKDAIPLSDVLLMLYDAIEIEAGQSLGVSDGIIVGDVARPGYRMLGYRR